VVIKKQMSPIRIIYQDKNFVAINKPAGLLVHLSEYQKKKEPTLVDWVIKNFPEVKNVGDDPQYRPGIVHRLDRDTSGAVLVALNQKYFLYLKKLFQDKKIKKTYLAIVKGTLREREGRIDKPIGIKSGTTQRSVFSEKMVKEAVTEYKLIKNFQKNSQNLSLLKVFPLTGRTHQIRTHLNFIGHPVAGDKMYGGKSASVLADRQMLHCYALEFEIEPGRVLCLEAEPPKDFIKMSGEINV
jgi:23S rRNA pseudouridine1911/1915/1917 synthase